MIKCEICSADVKRGRRFCSRKCDGVWKSIFYKGKRTGVDNKNWKRIEMKCKFCANKFFCKFSLAKNIGNNFCSHLCYSKFIKKNNVGEKSPKYKKDRYTIDTNGCWVWQLCKLPLGYGVLTFQGKKWRAHRFYYEKYKGKIPEGLFLDHLCSNPSCVNPEHLEAVTNKENLHRGKGTKVSDLDIINIRKLGKDNIHLILSKYDIGRTHAVRILNNKVRKI